VTSAVLEYLRQFRNETRGAVAIEAALAIPFLVVLGSGIIEFGSVFYNYGLVQTGIRDAARYLARVQEPATQEGPARNIAVSGTTAAGAARRVEWWQASHVRISYRQTPNPFDAQTGLRLYRGGDPLTTIRVEVAVDYPGLKLLPLFGFDKLRITAAHEERHVGQ
jgi:Flp pilus assembly protein TadG